MKYELELNFETSYGFALHDGIGTTTHSLEGHIQNGYELGRMYVDVMLEVLAKLGDLQSRVKRVKLWLLWLPVAQELIPQFDITISLPVRRDHNDPVHELRLVSPTGISKLGPGIGTDHFDRDALLELLSDWIRVAASLESGSLRDAIDIVASTMAGVYSD